MDNHSERSTHRRLTRRSSGRMIGGVAGGLADYTGLDPVLFRIGFIILSLAGGSGVLIYVLAWLAVPEENQAKPAGLHLLERMKAKRWLALAVIAIAGLVLMNTIDLVGVDWGFLWAAGLIGVGYVLLRDEPIRERSDAPLPPTAGTPPLPALGSTAPRPRRPRSPLGFLTLGAAFVVIAIAVLLSMSGALTLEPDQFMGLALVVLGAGLIVGAWWGRARLLVLVAMLLVPVTALASMIDVPFRGSISSNYISPRDEVNREYELLAGTLSLDLSRYRFGDEPTEIDISFFAGDVEVYVPPGVEVTTTGSMDVGVADLFGRGEEGRNLDLNGTFQREGTTEGELVLNIDGGLGSMDTTWAMWVDDNKRARQQQRERRERQERRQDRVEAKDRGRDSDRNRDTDGKRNKR